MLAHLLKSKAESARLASLLVLLLLPSFFTACSGSSSSPSRARANAPQTVQVTVAPALRQDLPIYLTGLGSIEAYYTVSVKSRVDGQLIDVKFKEGENVKKGALLAVIDPRPYQVQLDQAQAQLFKDQATLRDAQLNYQRYKDLLQNSGAMSQQQVDTQQATVDQLDGTVRNDQATVENAKLNLSLLPHHCSGERAHRPASGRSRKYRARQRCQSYAGHHASFSLSRRSSPCRKISCQLCRSTCTKAPCRSMPTAATT